MTIGAHAHVNACTCTRIESEYAQMSADMHTSGETDEDDRCECILAWMCAGGGGRKGENLCVRDGEMLNRHGSTMTAL